ncbi:MAG: hypothetical protein FJ279_04060, partial [Planctomycetes bacterium]|nr:hypothetical protein [Planctomycetota bacterium]
MSSALAATVETIPVKGNAWRVALADTDGDKQAELLYACYNGDICCQSAKGDVRWKFETGAFAFDLATQDINGDGRAEALVASSDGSLYALSSDGKLLWKFTSPAPLYSVAVGKVAQGKECQIVTGGIDRNVYLLSAAGKELARRPIQRAVTRVATGDLDGDGLDEVVATDYFCQVAAYTKLALEPLWRQRRIGDPRSPGGKQPWLAMSLDVADLDGDRRAEILLGSAFRNGNSVLCVDGKGEARWASESLALPQRPDIRFSMSIVKCADVVKSSPGLEVVALSGSQLIVLDKQGKVLQRGDAAMGFTDVAVDGATVYLGSSPNGDDRVYALRLHEGWEKAFAGLKREGAMLAVQRNIERIRERVFAYTGIAPVDRGPYVVICTRGSPNTKEKIRGHFGVRDGYRSRFPYPNLAFAAQFCVAEKGPLLDADGKSWPLDGRTLRYAVSADEIVDLARFCEENNFPVLYIVGHGCGPYIRLQTVERILQAAPKTCLGFMTSENTRWDESLTKYLKQCWAPLMDLCLKHGKKKAVMVEKVAWWATVPAHKEWHDLLFNGKYREVLVPSVEDSNSRSPELNLAGRVGLWLSGAVDTWSARLIDDLFCFNRFWEYGYPMHGHPFLRVLVAHTSLGASFF